MLQACRRDSSVASVEMYALKVASSLMVGVASGLWMFSPKTCQSWAGCASRLCARLTPGTGATGNGRRRNTGLVRPAVPAGRQDSRPELSSLSPAAASAGVGAVRGSSLYAVLDAQQRCNTVGRRTAALSLTTIL